jgi:hypothetical protein
MTSTEYLKLALRHNGIILLATLLSLLAGLLFWQGDQSLRFNNTILYVIGIENRDSTTDAYENLQAADLFTETIQGWFRDPSFLSSIVSESGLNFPIKSKKQEKNNLLISFPSDSSQNASTFSSQIEQGLRARLQQFNQISGLDIDLLPGGTNSTPSPNQLPLILTISLLSGLFLGFILAYFYEKSLSKLQSEQELAACLTDCEIFHFRNHRHLKKAPQFLVKYLQTNFGNSKLQILDLGSGSKTGLETISRHGNFQHIDSYDLPREIEKTSPERPALIIAELGKTSLYDLCSVAKLGFEKTIVVLLDRL